MYLIRDDVPGMGPAQSIQETDQLLWGMHRDGANGEKAFNHMRRMIWLSLPLVLAACGSGDEEAEKEIDYASYDDASLQQMFDQGELEQTLEIIHGQDDLGIADKTDYILAARIYQLAMNGGAAEALLKKAKEDGATEEETALLLAKAFVLQKRYERARQALDDVVLVGDEAYQALLIKGDIAKEEGQLEQAETFYNAAIDDKPDAPHGYTGLALLELFRGELEEAERYAGLAAERAPGDPIILYVQGTTARYLQDFPKAKEYLQGAIDANEKHILAHLELVGVHVTEGNLEAAEAELDKAYAINAEHSLAHYYSALIYAAKGEPKKAEAILLRLGNLTRDYPPAARVFGHVSHKLGRYSTAQPYLKYFLNLVPGDRETRLALVESYIRRGYGDEAMRTLEPVIENGTDDIEALLQAAAASGVMGNLEDAKKYLALAEGLVGDDERKQERFRGLARRHAVARYLTGEREGAVERLQAMVQEDPSDQTSLTLLANLQMQTGDIDGAEATIQKLVTVSPNDPVGLNLLGSIKYRKRQPEEAVRLYDAALSVNSDYVSARKNRALSYLALDKYAEAYEDLAAVLDATPQDSHVHAMTGRALLSLDRAREALPFLQRAESALPRSAIIRADHSRALAALEYTAAAISKAEEAKQLAPNNEGLNAYLDEMIAAWTVALEEDEAARDAAAEKRRLEREAEREAARKAAEELREQHEADEAKEAAQEEKPAPEEDQPPSL